MGSGWETFVCRVKMCFDVVAFGSTDWNRKELDHGPVTAELCGVSMSSWFMVGFLLQSTDFVPSAAVHQSSHTVVLQTQEWSLTEQN